MEEMEQLYKSYFAGIVYSTGGLADLEVIIENDKYVLCIEQLIGFETPQQLLNYHQELFTEFENWYFVDKGLQDTSTKFNVSDVDVDIDMLSGHYVIVLGDMQFDTLEDLYSYYKLMIIKLGGITSDI